jgi:undecaprenyl-diphosphatase
MGLCLWAADRWGKKDTSLGNLSWGKALAIGVAQGFAIIPGVSRSGVTITMGLLFGLEREAAVRFSFFLAIPITFGAGLLKSKYLVHNISDPAILTAMLLSLLSGLAAIHVLLTYVRKKSFTPFVVYRLALAAFIVGWLVIK